MPFSKYLPTKERLREIKSLRFLGEMIFDPNLWHLNLHSISYAALFGLFCCFLPIPFQMIPCALLCIWVRCNIPLALAFAWISNPITMPPMMYFAFKIGTHLLGQNNQVESIDLSLEWLAAQMAIVWQPLLLGSLACGVTAGLVGFATVHLFWRLRLSKYWRKRRQKLNFGD
ncbi:MAG: ATP-binding protein [Gammaproteobacteria bacterium]|nr:ATP-binding protein [Gammaproteobacteria bacterium]